MNELRRYVDDEIAFWTLVPLKTEETPFANLGQDLRVLGRDGQEYVVGTNRRFGETALRLPPGRWRITQVDLLNRRKELLAGEASGDFAFSSPDSRAALTHFRSID